MEEGVFSESWPDLFFSLSTFSFMQMTHVYTSLTNHVFALVRSSWWRCHGGWGGGRGGQSQTVPGKPQIKRQPEHNRSIGRSDGANYKHWGNSWLIAPKHNYQPAQKKLMYDCSGAAARQVLMHLSLKLTERKKKKKKSRNIWKRKNSWVWCVRDLSFYHRRWWSPTGSRDQFLLNARWEMKVWKP